MESILLTWCRQTVHPEDSTLSLEHHFHLKLQLFIPRMFHHTLKAGLWNVSSTTALPASQLHPMMSKPQSWPRSLHFYYAPEDSLSLDIFCAVFPIFREQTCFSLLLWTMEQKTTVWKGSQSLDNLHSYSSQCSSPRQQCWKPDLPALPFDLGLR